MAASQGLDYFYSVHESLLLAGIAPVKVRFVGKMCPIFVLSFYVILGIREMFNRNLGKLFLNGERL